MTLASLKKRAPSVNRPVMSVEEFIDDADFYARGLSKVVALPCPNKHGDDNDAILKRATFTLGETAINQLSELSVKTGIAKSRLIRIWLSDESESGNVLAYINSQVK